MIQQSCVITSNISLLTHPAETIWYLTPHTDYLISHSSKIRYIQLRLSDISLLTHPAETIWYLTPHKLDTSSWDYLISLNGVPVIVIIEAHHLEWSTLFCFSFSTHCTCNSNTHTSPWILNKITLGHWPGWYQLTIQPSHWHCQP